MTKSKWREEITLNHKCKICKQSISIRDNMAGYNGDFMHTECALFDSMEDGYAKARKEELEFLEKTLKENETESVNMFPGYISNEWHEGVNEGMKIFRKILKQRIKALKEKKK